MRFTAWLVLVATLLLWSGNWIVARAVRDDVAPGIATFARIALVLAILVPFTARGLHARLPALSRGDWLLFAVLGFTGGGVNMALQWLGLHYTTATSGILYLSTTPIFILLFALPLRERIGWLQLAGVAISFCGVAAIATQGIPARLAALSFNIGDIMALGSMIMFAAYTVLLRVHRYELNSAEMLTIVCAFGLLFMVPWVALELYAGRGPRINLAGALAILYSAVGSQLLGYLGWSHVVMRLGAAAAGVTLHLMPVMGIALAALLLGEYPEWFHFAGIALILLGVALSTGRLKMGKPKGEESMQ